MSSNSVSANLLRISDEDLDGDHEMREHLGNPFTGIAYAKYSNGNLETEITCLDGRPDGLCREWYPNGQQRREWTARSGPVHGVCTEWYDDGAIKSVAKYSCGVEVIYDEWSASGELITHRELDDQSPMHGLIAKLEQTYNKN